MPFSNGHAVDSARHNQIDQTNNGVVGYRSHQHSVGQGPLGVSRSGSSSAIELTVNGGTVTIDGLRVSVTPSSVTLEPGFVEGPRKDVIYIGDDGSVNALTGAPGQATIPVVSTDANGNPTTDLRTPPPHQNPMIEPQSTKNLKGTVIAVVAVQPSDSASTDLTQNDIQDRRKAAPDMGPDFPAQPAIMSEMMDLPAGQYRMWPMHVRAGQTLQLWSYFMYHSRFGIFDYSGEMDRRIIEMGSNELKGPSEYGPDEDPWDMGPKLDSATLWRSTTNPLYEAGVNSPIFEFDVPSNESASGYAFFIQNNGDLNFRMPLRGIGFQSRLTVQQTDQL